MNVRSELFKTALQCASQTCDAIHAELSTDEGVSFSELDTVIAAHVELLDVGVAGFDVDAQEAHLTWEDRPEEGETQ